MADLAAGLGHPEVVVVHEAVAGRDQDLGLGLDQEVDLENDPGLVQRVDQDRVIISVPDQDRNHDRSRALVLVLEADRNPPKRIDPVPEADHDLAIANPAPRAVVEVAVVPVQNRKVEADQSRLRNNLHSCFGSGKESSLLAVVYNISLVVKFPLKLTG